MAYARIARVCDVAIKVCGAACAAVYRAYAIRPYKRRKTKVAKTTSNVEKTMSYVEKIMSDIIQTTSDLFLSPANICVAKVYEEVMVWGSFVVFRLFVSCRARKGKAGLSRGKKKSRKPLWLAGLLLCAYGFTSQVLCSCL